MQISGTESGTDLAMKPHSNLQISKHGIYYLRIQRAGIDRRISLRTRDPYQARIAAAICHATLSHMKIDPTKIKGWTLKSDGRNVEISTEDNDADRADAQLALDKILGKITLITQQPVSTIAQPTISLADAINKYHPIIESLDLKPKTKAETHSTLEDLKRRLGADFDMAQINNKAIENAWLKPKLAEISAVNGSKNTAKKSLSFIRKFIEWAAHEDQKYTPVALTLSVSRVKDRSYIPFDSDDLRNIFTSLPDYAEEAWQFWIPVIELYTGARISEVASLKTEYFFRSGSIDVMHLDGTKTDAAMRDIPIHPDLLKIGLHDLVESRRSLNKEMLFDLPYSTQNGFGAKPSKDFTKFKALLGITNDRKCSHSFRHNMVHHMTENEIENIQARCAYVGHDAGGLGTHVKSYSQNAVSLRLINNTVVSKLDFMKCYDWEPDIEVLKAKADSFLIGK